MKKIYVIVFGLLMAARLQGQVILNPGFEGGFRAVVVTSSLPPVNLNSVAPANWYCADSLIASLAPGLMAMGFINANFNQQCFEDTIRTSGDFAVGIKSSNLVDTIQIPGILSNAKMSFNITEFMQNQDIESAFSYSGGTPALGKKVDEVKAKVFLDTLYKKDGSMMVTAYAKHPATNEYAAIGEGYVSITPDTVYQDVSVTVDYFDANFTATDTFVIVFFSSNDYEVTSDPLNYMLIDDVEASYSEGSRPSSVRSLYTAADVKLYPVPAEDRLHITFNAYKPGTEYSINIVGVDGKLLRSAALTANTAVVDMSAFVPGMYVVELVENNATVYRQKVTKK